MMHILVKADLFGKLILVLCNDTDVCCLLLTFYCKIKCANIVVKWFEEIYLDIGMICSSLSEQKAKCFIGLHSLTGCDTLEKICGKSKLSWVKVFLSITDISILNAIRKFPYQHYPTEEESLLLEKVVGLNYVPKRCNFNRPNEARWHVFKKNSSDPERLPSTTGALFPHALRSFLQANIWAQAEQPFIENLNLVMFL